MILKGSVSPFRKRSQQESVGTLTLAHSVGAIHTKTSRQPAARNSIKTFWLVSMGASGRSCVHQLIDTPIRGLMEWQDLSRFADCVIRTAMKGPLITVKKKTS